MGANTDFKNKLIGRAFDFARDIIRLVDSFPKNKPSSKVIANQLIRSATSIGANIIEAQAASSRKDFTNFLNHALKSGNETKFWLALAKDLDQDLTSFINTLLHETEELTNILGSSLITLRSKNSKI